MDVKISHPDKIPLVFTLEPADESISVEGFSAIFQAEIIAINTRTEIILNCLYNNELIEILSESRTVLRTP